MTLLIMKMLSCSRTEGWVSVQYPHFQVLLSQMRCTCRPCRKEQLPPENEECPNSVRLWGCPASQRVLLSV